MLMQSNGNETYGMQRIIMDKKFKLVYNGFDYDELYNLKNDLQEMENLAYNDEYAAVKKQQYTQMWKGLITIDGSNNNDYIVTAMADFGSAIVFSN